MHQRTGVDFRRHWGLVMSRTVSATRPRQQRADIIRGASPPVPVHRLFHCHSIAVRHAYCRYAVSETLPGWASVVRIRPATAVPSCRIYLQQGTSQSAVLLLLSLA